MSDPTPEEIARVKAYQVEQRRRETVAYHARVKANTAAKVRALVTALQGERIAHVEVGGMDEWGELSLDGFIKLTLASGRVVDFEIEGYDDRRLGITIVEPT